MGRLTFIGIIFFLVIGILACCGCCHPATHITDVYGELPTKAVGINYQGNDWYSFYIWSSDYSEKYYFLYNHKTKALTGAKGELKRRDY